ncbi:hypothetical protein C8F04DRAFT_1199002 [Mycena alexandri]|uniref:Uncharacterized protein n=1 Tax=Mycena alexandri TaxID=1745969 RepID=A0AAD6S0U0_9AGAR|nr:hypothetical protein C8F04DRAFT_1199002 [Mycena alexandri]
MSPESAAQPAQYAASGRCQLKCTAPQEARIEREGLNAERSTFNPSFRAPYRRGDLRSGAIRAKVRRDHVRVVHRSCDRAGGALADQISSKSVGVTASGSRIGSNLNEAEPDAAFMFGFRSLLGRWEELRSNLRPQVSSFHLQLGFSHMMCFFHRDRPDQEHPHIRKPDTFDANLTHTHPIRQNLPIWEKCIQMYIIQNNKKIIEFEVFWLWRKEATEVL